MKTYPYEPEEELYLERNYPDMDDRKIAKILEKPIGSIRSKAAEKGLKKNPKPKPLTWQQFVEIVCKKYGFVKRKV